ncbi:Uncharacterised protein [Acinetobacter baumannii]|uniref:phage head spike fiber domain-containing protein n=1 Tax=Acinetobacter baumannii TaxID=470 RepID=UPI000DE65AC4|nr:hypothetical protein [Acinetobacter baumannii]SSQ07960.1 Uncharacterised protein [Acinetobacter baumannii]
MIKTPLNTVIGGAFWTPGATVINGKEVFSVFVKSLFANGEQGFAYDLNDLTAEKLNWRRNMLTETEFRNGVSDASIRSGAVTATSFEGLQSNTGLAIGFGSLTYVYKSITVNPNVTYTFSTYVRMADGSAPILSSHAVDAAGDFCLVFQGNTVPSNAVNIVDLGGGLYRVSVTKAAVSSGSYFGVVKYTGNSQRTCSVSGYQLEKSNTLTEYQPITDFNTEFLKQFPQHTLFQDAAGTIPVTDAGRPVGLMLDKSKGLLESAELFTQAIDFTTWGKTALVTSTTSNSFTTSGRGGCIKKPLFSGISAQKTYTVRIKGNCNVAHIICSSTSTTGQVSIPAGNFDVTLRTSVTFADTSIYFQLEGAGTMTVNSISVKEIAGNHAYQTTSSMRPLLAASPQRLDYDIADDKLTTTLPAQLTGCTVIRSVPNVGAQILTGQTIPATYEDNKDHCGLIVINRALTPSETSAIAAEFNKRAGV